MKEKISESSTVKYCTSNLVSSSTLTTTAGYWGGISTTDHTMFVSNGTLSVCNAFPDPNQTKKKVLEGIMDGLIELESLIDNGTTETYEIAEISFKERKTRFSCQKEVSLEYVEKLKGKSELLLEFTPKECDDHKKNAIQHSEGSVLVNRYGTVTPITYSPSIWTYIPGNVTSGTETITINGDGFSTNANISYA